MTQVLSISKVGVVYMIRSTRRSVVDVINNFEWKSKFHQNKKLLSSLNLLNSKQWFFTLKLLIAFNKMVYYCCFI